MKYTDKNKPLQCMFTQSGWAKEMGSYSSKPVGILWHDTGAGNPNLKRYVQPSTNDANRSALLKKIGTNGNGNDWNRSSAPNAVNAFIGKFADGTVGTVQVGPWTRPPYGCGAGDTRTGTKRGLNSCNGYIYTDRYEWQGVHWIQFEICDDFYESKDYFNKCYKEAVELTAYLCKLYNINPNGKVNFNGITVPTILCHGDAHALNMGSGHADVNPWFKKFGKTMQNVRNDVTNLLKESEVEVFKKGETSLGIEATKAALGGLVKLGILTKGMEKNGGYGDGVDVNVKAVQKTAGLTQKSEIDDNTVKAIWTQLENGIAKKLTELSTAKKDLTDTKNTLTTTKTSLAAAQKDLTNAKDVAAQAKVALADYKKTAANKEAELNKKIEEANAKIAALNAQLESIEKTASGDINGDGKVNIKDLLELRKIISGVK